MSLIAENLSVSHGAFFVLKDVTMQLRKGEVTGIIGPNGVGKSSLLKVLAGLGRGTGTVSSEGRSLTEADRRRIVAYMPQDSSAGSSLTLTEVVLLGRLGSLGLRVSPVLIEGVQRILSEFGLASLSYRTLDAVSGGQRQLTYLAQALFREPRILLLDEPTAALDLRHQLVVFDTLRRLAREKNIAIAVAVHDLSLAAQFCDQVTCLCHGKIDAVGPPAEVLTADRLARIYGIEAEVTRDADDRLRIAAIRAI